MNKEKLLYTFNEMGKKGVNQIDFIVFFGSLVLGAFAVDLNLQYVSAVAGFFFCAELGWIICSILSFVITEIIIRKKNKNKVGQNIEKLIDEESEK